MSVLVYLARHRGQVVSRTDLESGVWSGMVVGYDAVTNAVIKLRRAFGDDSRAPRIIKTPSPNRGKRRKGPGSNRREKGPGSNGTKLRV